VLVLVEVAATITFFVFFDVSDDLRIR
jgi:hypothetical protein